MISPAVIIAGTMITTARGVQSRTRKRMDCLLSSFCSCSLEVRAPTSPAEAGLMPLRSCGRGSFELPFSKPAITVLTVCDGKTKKLEILPAIRDKSGWRRRPKSLK